MLASRRNPLGLSPSRLGTIGEIGNRLCTHRLKLFHLQTFNVLNALEFNRCVERFG